jgi:3-oxoacyl-[acyl-carrier protein] reductase
MATPTPSWHLLAAAAAGAALVYMVGPKVAAPSLTPHGIHPSTPVLDSEPGLLVITGASKGIGLATAKIFLDAGWRVVNLSRSECPLKGVMHRPTDLCESGWEATFEIWAKSELFGNSSTAVKICVVHNAAVMVRDSSLAVDPAELRRALEVNVVAPAALNRVLNPFLGPGSSILYMGSTLSEKGIPGSASYVSSKHAVAGLMKVTCQDLAGRQVHTVCICPGFTATDMVVEHLGNDPSVREAILGIQTMGRILEPSEVAAVVHFCATNPSTNGAVLHANLGQVER